MTKPIMSPINVSFPSNSLTLAGHLYLPETSAPSRNGTSIVISHPMCGVKEQTSATHAQFLANLGFTCLTFDAAYQGESSGLPRGLEDPHQRAEDVKAAVSYLTTLGEQYQIDPSRIGVLGICASGGYTSFAAQTDRRIKALATVSGACVGRMTRSGGDEASKADIDDEAAINGALQAAAEWRTTHAHNPTAVEPPVYFDPSPSKVTKDTPVFLAEASDYYGTKRGAHERSNQKLQPQSVDLMMNYDSFAFQRLIGPRALLMIVGSEASTRHYSESAVHAAREPKELFVVEGQTHVGLYDDLSVSGPKLVEFFAKYLA